MNRQARINGFSLAAHRLAVVRLREQPARLNEALAVLDRWRQQAGGSSHCDPYWDEWEHLLRQGTDVVERAVCVPTDRAETLCSMSPLSRFISTAQRNDLLRQTREAA